MYFIVTTVTITERKHEVDAANEKDARGGVQYAAEQGMTLPPCTETIVYDPLVILVEQIDD